MTDLYTFVSLDLPPLLTALFAALSCALLGNFLVLRRMSLMGDAIAHAVLPGIVLAFLLTGSRATLPMFIGAAVAGIVAAVLIELVRSLGKVEAGAAMGAVFSIMFAAGVLLIEQAAARTVDLDPDCLLHGQLERIFWFPPQDGEFFSLATLAQLPRELTTSIAVFFGVALLIGLLFKELTLSAFDAGLARSLGFNPSLLHYILMVLVACAVVASFEAVGSILVIAMLICPAASARLLTDRLKIQIALSLVFAATSSVGGYFLAAFAPPALGWHSAVNAAGAMTVLAGLILIAVILCGPQYGVLGRRRARRSAGTSPFVSELA